MTNRRNWLTNVVAGAAAASTATNLTSAITQAQEQPAVPEKKLMGRIRQSVMGWCFKPMSAEDLARLGKKLGLVAIEGIDAAKAGKLVAVAGDGVEPFRIKPDYQHTNYGTIKY